MAIAVATAASTALPPRFNISSPIWAARACEVQTIPRSLYTTLRRDGYRCSYVFRSASMSQPPERYILFVPIVAHSGRDCRSATMIPPFSTLPSAAKIYSRVYAMFVPPARLGQFDVYRAAPGRFYQLLESWSKGTKSPRSISYRITTSPSRLVMATSFST